MDLKKYFNIFQYTGYRYIYIYIYLYIHIYVYIYTCIYIYMHKQIYRIQGAEKDVAVLELRSAAAENTR